MAIDALRDGFVRFCFDTSANQLGDKCRMVLEGQFLSSAPNAPTADVLMKAPAPRDIDSVLGAGSVLAESLKVAQSCCGNDAVDIFILPRADAAGAVKAVYELTVTGTATSDGRIDIYWGEASWNISVRVETGDTPTDIAADIAAAAPDGFPFDVTSALGVVTLTAKNGGTVGNFLNVNVNWHNRQNYMPGGVSIAVSQTTQGSGDPAALSYSSVLGGCCVCCYAMLYSTEEMQDAVIAHFDDAWDCSKPQCFGHSYTYDAGTLGQVLAKDTNSATVSRMAHGAANPILPYLRVAAYAAQSCCLTVDNPETAIQGQQFGVLECIRAPESCSSEWTFDEQEQLRDGGFVVTVPLTGGEGGLTSPMVTNDITNNRYDADGKENPAGSSVSGRRLDTATATQIATELARFNGLSFYSANTRVRDGVRGVNKSMILGHMRAWAKDNVGVLFSEFDDLNQDIQLRTDFENSPRCQGMPGVMHLNFVYRRPVRVSQINVNAVTKLLDNC